MRMIPGPGMDLREDAVQIATYLVDARGMSLDDLRRAISLQREQELRFSEAVLALGLATDADLAGAKGHRSAPSTAAKGFLAAELEPVRSLGQLQAQKLGALRAQLSLRMPVNQGLRLAVVSATAGDGRSWLAAALAVTCSMLEQPTLLIDADLRGPAQHRLFGLCDDQGLVQALNGSAVPRPAGVEGLPHLAVLPAGGMVQGALELLSGRPLCDLIESYSTRYRHIIVDTPAMQAGYDGVATAMACGAALLLARRDHSPMDANQKLVTQLRATPARILGGVLR